MYQICFRVFLINALLALVQGPITKLWMIGIFFSLGGGLPIQKISRLGAARCHWLSGCTHRQNAPSLFSNDPQTLANALTNYPADSIENCLM